MTIVNFQYDFYHYGNSVYFPLALHGQSGDAHNMGLAKAGVQSELQPFVLLIIFGAVRQ
jgi:hypothetical protein